MIHDFDDDLAYSHAQSDAPHWEEVYHQAFPDMVAMHDLRHDGWHQRAGRDRAIVLSTGRSLFVDEKVRRQARGDILVEIWSVYPQDGRPPYPTRPGAKPGWARKAMDCDFLAYAFAPTRTCHLFSMFGLRTAVEKHRIDLIRKAGAEVDGYQWVRAHNKDYDTVSIAVPTRDLYRMTADAMTVCWTPGDVERSA